MTSKGQITIPVDVREALGIDKDTYLEVTQTANEIRLRKIVPTRPVADDDPIWRLVGTAEAAAATSRKTHDTRLADAEIERWRSPRRRAPSSRSSGLQLPAISKND